MAVQSQVIAFEINIFAEDKDRLTKETRKIQAKVKKFLKAETLRAKKLHVTVEVSIFPEAD
jgi:hypothetical protein